MHSLSQEISVQPSVLAATYTSAGNGSVVDTLGFNTLVAIVTAGAIDLTSTDETYTVKLQEGAAANLSDAADITGATVTITAANQQKKIALNDLGSSARKRYIRAVITPAGTTPSIAVAVPIVLARGFNNPQS